MGKILINSQGKAIIADGNAFEVTAAIDANIQAGNIKKDVSILGVTGNYEGNVDPNPIAEDNDVIFVDFDGKIRYSFTAEEFLALQAFPDNPQHEGLIPNGWNWDFEVAIDYVRKYGELVIGQTYRPADDKCHLFIEFPYDGYYLTVPLNFQQNEDNGAVFDWGDGSPFESIAGTGKLTISHTYSKPGKYEITVGKTSGSVSLGHNSSSRQLFGSDVYRRFLKKIYTSRNIGLTNYVFMSWDNYIECSTDVEYKSWAFQNSRIKCIIYGKTQMSNGNVDIKPNVGTFIAFSSVTSAFNRGDGTGIIRGIIPESITYINTFDLLYQKRVKIPKNVTKIDVVSTYMKELWLYPTTPPTVTSNISNIQSDCVIYVPADSLSAYQSASNWSSVSDKMRAMPSV